MSKTFATVQNISLLSRCYLMINYKIIKSKSYEQILMKFHKTVKHDLRTN